MSISMESSVFNFINQDLYVLTPIRRRDLASLEGEKCYGDSFLSQDGLLAYIFTTALLCNYLGTLCSSQQLACFTSKRTVGHLLCLPVCESCSGVPVMFLCDMRIGGSEQRFAMALGKPVFGLLVVKM